MDSGFHSENGGRHHGDSELSPYVWSEPRGTRSQILLTARLANLTVLSAGSTSPGEFGPGLGSSI